MKTTKRQERIAQRLEEIAAQENGRLTPERVVADATDTLSPLHAEFEWDDAKAAHQHRLDQARAMIREVRVLVTERGITIPVIAYVRDPEAHLDEQGYVAVPRLRNAADLAREALQYEVERAMASLGRAHEVARALGLDHELAGMREALGELRMRLAA